MKNFRKNTLFKLACYIVCGLGGSFSVQAETSTSKHFAHHIVGVFIGATSFEEKHGRQEEATYGIGYEYRFNKHFSIGAVYETSPDAHDNDGIDVQLINAYYRPDTHWRLGVGFGEEKVGGDHPHDEPLKRIGAAYDFHLGSFGIAPAINVDFVDDKTAYVVGIEILKAF